jgi:hypothetical protein
MRADMRRASSLAFLLALALFLAACGSKQAPESKAPAPEIDHERDDSGGVEMTQEFGGMNEEKVKKTIEKLYPTLSDCLMNGSKRVDFLGGEVAFLVKVNSAGTAEVAHAERSTRSRRAAGPSQWGDGLAWRARRSPSIRRRTSGRPSIGRRATFRPRSRRTKAS